MLAGIPQPKLLDRLFGKLSSCQIIKSLLSFRLPQQIVIIAGRQFVHFQNSAF